MNVTASAVSLNVRDLAASRTFLVEHFGFSERHGAEGIVSSLVRDDALNIVLLQQGSELLPDDVRDQHATGVIVALTVQNLVAEEGRLRRAGAPITMPLREEPWGERLFQVTDPSGLVIQLMDWGPSEQPA
ncbi:MAG: VOC family protein [Gemmatimonadaceae bacterium]|jgi:uncharacterized glyoxalase superfamily protein PhnB|nr:VOC family protein [Gemmatimonadaceae bacterium]